MNGAVANCSWVKNTPTRHFCQKVEGQNGEILVDSPTYLYIPHGRFGDPMEIIAFVFLAMLISLSGFMLYREFSHVNGRVEKLEERVHKLEFANNKRMPHASQEEILNGMAALDVLMREFTFGVDVVENAKAHFAKSLQVGTKREEGTDQ